LNCRGTSRAAARPVKKKNAPVCLLSSRLSLARLRFSVSLPSPGGNANDAPPTPTPSAPATRYAVIGGGFAGVAAAWHLIAAHNAARTPATPPPHLTLFDPRGLCAGGSGAAGGLLHPYSPSGGLLWEGRAAFEAAVELVGVAERGGKGGGGPIASRGVAMLRPAEDGAQAAGWVRRRAAAVGEEGGDASPSPTAHPPAFAGLLSAAAAGAALPGVALPAAGATGEGGGGEAAPPPAAWATTAGLIVHPARYLDGLWAATQAAAAGAGGTAALDTASPPVTSLAALDGGGGVENDTPRPRFRAIILAGGAGTGTVAEAAPLAARLDLIGGATGDWRTGSGENGGGGDASSSSSPPWLEGVALLGRWYAAPVPGGGAIRVGATRDRKDGRGADWSPAAAAAAGGGGPAPPGAARSLAAGLAAAWPPGRAWGPPHAVVTGVRALAPRSSAGRPPLAGRLEREDGGGPPGNWWAIAGLGSRGLTYAAWVAAAVARAAVVDGGGAGAEAGLPAELTRWRRGKAARASPPPL